jgi:hypothetical protein
MDKTTICNLALSHLASSAEITDIDDDRSKEAKACRRFYDVARDRVLRAFPWPFAVRTVQPALVYDYTDVTAAEWDYGYRYPIDALRLNKIQNEYHQRNDLRATRVPYRIMSDDAGRIILCDLVDPILEYTSKIEDPEKFDPDFVTAFSLYLASLIAPRVTAGDQFKLGHYAYQRAISELENAKANALNEEQVDSEPDAEMILVRE